MPVGLSAEKKLTMMESACCRPATVHKSAEGEPADAVGCQPEGT